MGVNEQRGEPAIPSDFEKLLSEEQRLALDQLKPFGWSVHQVRRPPAEPVEIILEHTSGKFAKLTDTGELAHEPQSRPRSESVPAEEQAKQQAATVSNEPVPRPGGTGANPAKKILV